MAHSNTFVIPLNSPNNAMSLFVACIGIASCCVLLYLSLFEMKVDFYSRLIGAFSILILASLAYAGINLTRRLLDGSPGLVLDVRGVTGSSVAFSAGFIAWSDIASFILKSLGRNGRRLYVFLKNDEKYMATCSPLNRIWLRATGATLTSPVTISPDALAIEANALVALLNERLAASRAE
jgi:hypothetical protein